MERLLLTTSGMSGLNQPFEPTSCFRHLAEQLVDREQPGTFNQALMELGAIVCTPKSPTCSVCPISEHCVALKMVQ